MDQSGYSTQYSLDFSNNDYTKYFNTQYSYTNHSTPAKYFNITTFNGKHVLFIRLYSGDAPFKNGSDTNPRSELRETATPLTNDNEYVFEWSSYLNTDTEWDTFHGILNQYFSNNNGPCDDITAMNNDYHFMYITSPDSDAKSSKVIADPSPNGDKGHWVDYFVRYKVSHTDGYIEWYRGSPTAQSTCSLVFGYNGTTARSGNDYNYFKLGMYSGDNTYSSLYVTDFRLSIKK